MPHSLTNAGSRPIIPGVRIVIVLATLAGLLAGPVLAHATIYCWRDDHGVTNYVDDASKVPEEYRDQIRTVDSIARATDTKPEAPSVDEVASRSFAEGYRTGAAERNRGDHGAPTVVEHVQIVESAPVPFFAAVLVPRGRVRARHPVPPRFGGGFIRAPAGHGFRTERRP